MKVLMKSVASSKATPSREDKLVKQNICWLNNIRNNTYNVRYTINNGKLQILELLTKIGQYIQPVSLSMNTFSMDIRLL